MPTICDVCQGYERVAAEVAGVSLRYVPPAIIGQQRLAVFGEHGEQVHLALFTGRESCSPVVAGRHLGRQPVGRADILAIVAAVDAVAQANPVLDREDTRSL